MILSQCRGCWGHFTRSLLGPRLEVLEGVEGGVMHTQRIRRHRFAHGLLQGVGLKLEQHPIGLLASRLSFLSCLPSRGFEEAKKTIINPKQLYSAQSNQCNICLCFEGLWVLSILQKCWVKNNFAQQICPTGCII